MQSVNVSIVNSLSFNMWTGISPSTALSFIQFLNNFLDIICRKRAKKGNCEHCNIFF